MISRYLARNVDIAVQLPKSFDDGAQERKLLARSHHIKL
jgi:hypothetical protein